MLIEEKHILDRPAFQHTVVVPDESGVHADWVRLSLNLDKLARDEDQHKNQNQEQKQDQGQEQGQGERQFLEIVLAVSLGRQVLLDSVRGLDERRLGIVLRALAAWAGADSIAVGTRS
ncbi:hypothetical protein AT728_28065 [Streptomyces silvensis]|uniref:Uncharacterized protein n=2 Tax=Streptomyces silvensis TaxID=1765722 RepID=A0A0W7XAR4_9ACTN|nr:hypothetical protein AT728_28065 [Streptomyces silvensis]